VRNGDISNETPLRVVVTLDCVLDRSPTLKRVLGIPVVGEESTYNRQSLSLFWRFAEKYGYTLELAGFGYSQKEMDEVLEDLNNMGTNPFNYVHAYPVVADLVAELPYRPELVGIVDIPSRGLRFGSKYLDMGRLM
jgi:hypothetical protein